jgi:hypothetical protein
MYAPTRHRYNVGHSISVKAINELDTFLGHTGGVFHGALEVAVARAAALPPPRDRRAAAAMRRTGLAPKLAPGTPIGRRATARDPPAPPPRAEPDPRATRV